MMNSLKRLVILSVATGLPGAVLGNPFPLVTGDSVIGQIETGYSLGIDRPVDVARRRGLGHSEIKLVNPSLDVWLPGNSEEFVLPMEFVLPNAPHIGIVLNVPEMRLYYFRANKATGGMDVMTFPIGIGREGWDTPYSTTRVATKVKDPVWYPPESIRAEHAAEGDPLPKRVGPGPDNPMGAYALRLALPMYAIHGTNKPWGVGMRVSHGCIRLYNEHIEELFQAVQVGMPVNIVNQPYKVGLRGDRIFLEAHPSLEEDQESFEGNLTSVVRAVVAMTREGGYEADWDLARQIIQQSRGIPVQIGRLKPEPHSILAAARPAAEPAPRVRTRESNAGMELKLDVRLPLGSR
ncbi:MAG: L,D-transpeptidase family protein [Gammaproteobacteria bacterium]|nr:L,D-transpeptidase family protein [Gammaproteobacteria bacterium]